MSRAGTDAVMSTRDVVRRVSWVAMLCGLAVVVPARPASACSCDMRAVCAAFWEADRVFIGRAEVTPLGRGAQLTRFRVEESFRGPAGVIEIVARGIGGAARMPSCTARSTSSSHGAPPTGAGARSSAIRSLRSIRLARACGSLATSRVTRARAGESSVRRRLRPAGPGDSSHPPRSSVARMLTLRRGSYVRSATADASGVFELRDVPPGLYSLTIAPVPDTEPLPAVPIEIKGSRSVRRAIDHRVQKEEGRFTLNARSTASLTSVDTGWSRQSQRIMSGKIVPPCFWPCLPIPH